MAPRKRDHRAVPLALRAVVLLLFGLLALGACGGDETVPAYDDLVIDQAALAKMDLGEFHETMTEASNRLIERHGGDEAAFSAVFVALDQGYDASQLLTGALNDRLEADGHITDAEGKDLAPARPAEGIIQAAGDSDGSETSGGATGAPEEPVVLACLSGSPLFLADASTLIGETKVLVGFSRHQVQQLTTLDQLFDGFKEVREGIRTREAKEKEEQKKREAALAGEMVTKVLTELAARGYSAQQIAQAAVLLQTDAKYQTEIDAYVWDCLHTSGSALRPVHQPVALSDGPYGPAVDQNTPTSYDPEDIQAALDGLGDDGDSGGDDGPGDDSGDAGGSGGDGSGDDGSKDPDGIQDGIYAGEVRIVNHTSIWTLEIVESVVELDVTEDGIAATVEFVVRHGTRMINEEEVCIVTYRMLCYGAGPVTDPLSLTLEVVEAEIIDIVGTHSGVSDRWSTTAEQDMLAYFAETTALPLSGSFTDGHFEGSLTPLHAVTAAIDD